MSRTRQKPNEIDLWLFPKETVETNYSIENVEQTVGIQFKAEDLGMKTRSEVNILGGHSYQGSTVNVYRTTDQRVQFISNDPNAIGYNVAKKPNPSNNELSSIVKISSKPINKRGARHNTFRVVEYTFEVS